MPGAPGAECVSVRVLVVGTMGWYNLILAGYWMWRVLVEVTIVEGAGGYELPYCAVAALVGASSVIVYILFQMECHRCDLE